MDRTGSGSCLAAGFNTSGVELPGSNTYTELISKIDFREIGRENGSWVELVEYRVQWRCLAF